MSAGERDFRLSDFNIVSKFSQSWVKVESKLSQRAAGCVRTQERDCRLPDLASQAAAAGQCYRCQSATAATSTVLQVLRCYSRVLTRCFRATVQCYCLLPATTCTVKPTWQKCRNVELCTIQHILRQFRRWKSELWGRENCKIRSLQAQRYHIWNVDKVTS